MMDGGKQDDGQTNWNIWLIEILHQCTGFLRLPFSVTWDYSCLFTGQLTVIQSKNLPFLQFLPAPYSEHGKPCCFAVDETSIQCLNKSQKPGKRAMSDLPDFSSSDYICWSWCHQCSNQLFHGRAPSPTRHRSFCWKMSKVNSKIGPTMVLNQCLPILVRMCWGQDLKVEYFSFPCWHHLFVLQRVCRLTWNQMLIWKYEPISNTVIKLSN